MRIVHAERLPDRFIVGIDGASSHSWQTQAYVQLVQLMQTWLGRLAPAARRKFSSDSFERILAAKQSERLGEVAERVDDVRLVRDRPRNARERRTR